MVARVPHKHQVVGSIPTPATNGYDPRMGIVKIESRGSYWWINEDERVHMRLPKTEAPREREEWGNALAGKLQDAVWHEYESWELVDRSLRIHYLDHMGNELVVFAPL